MRSSALQGTKKSAKPIGTASFLVPARHDEPELLDQGIGTAEDVRANLREMWRINRYLGGLLALTRQLFPLLRKTSEPRVIVDIGTGSASVMAHIGRWAKRRSQNVTVYGIDISARNLSFAHENIAGIDNVHLIQSDAMKLPFQDQSIDYFISSLFLHHFTPDEIVKLLSYTYTSAKRGIVMNDLVRGYLPMAGFLLIMPLFARNYLTRHDGMLSIRRAYTANELLALAYEAGLNNARVVRAFPFRITLIAEKTHV